MIELTRETVAILVSAAHSLYPTLHALNHTQAWPLGEAISEAETALLNEEDDGPRGACVNGR